jgi:hypothetical protein
VKLERRWNTALTKYHVPVFHMSEFNLEEKYQKANSPYKGWSDAKKKRFLPVLINIASKIPFAGYGSMVESKAWDSILDDHAKMAMPVGHGKKARVVQNPYIECFAKFFAKFPQFLDNAVNPLLSKCSPVSKVAFRIRATQGFRPSGAIRLRNSKREVKGRSLWLAGLLRMQESSFAGRRSSGFL